MLTKVTSAVLTLTILIGVTFFTPQMSSPPPASSGLTLVMSGLSFGPANATAAITPAMSNQARLDMMTTIAGHTLKIALYTQAAASLSAATTVYTTSGEVTGTGYSAGGVTLVGCSASLVGGKAQITCSNPSWANSTITADGAMLYDATVSNHTLATYTFTSKSSSSGTFTITIPADLLYLQ